MGKGWTPERRARQAELIRTWKPWEQATGPRSDEGKARAAKNAFRGGKRAAMRTMFREVRQALRRQRDSLAEW